MVSPARLIIVMMLSLSAGLAGCLVVGTDYVRPKEVFPTLDWQAALPHGGSQDNLTDWWGRFDDETLTVLIRATLDHHPSLEGALAAIEVARANVTMQQAGALGKVDAAGKVSRSGNHRYPADVEKTTLGTAVDAVWELDLFGRVKRATEEAQAKVAARQADWYGLRVSLAAEVATLTTEWRGCIRLRESLDAELSSREKTEKMTESSVQAGLSAPSDGALARAGVAETRSQRTLQQASCDLVIKGLVALSGLEEGRVRHDLESGGSKWPKVARFVVTVVPAKLLAQRPDLASAEEELVAANAAVGVAKGAWYPRFSLLGSVGIGIIKLGSANVDNQPWSFGPALTLPVWDGGVRDATLRSAEGRRQIALASYRLAVQTAVREVESAMVNLTGTVHRTEDARKAASGYAAYFSASEENWRKGGLSLLSLEEARRKHIAAQRAVIQLERMEVQQWITLYKALGGGWHQDTASNTHEGAM